MSAARRGDEDRQRVLAAECRTFARHLVGGEPDDYIVSCYIAAHSARPGIDPGDAADQPLLAMARSGALGTRLADAHSRIFVPRSALRRKLILLLAILETSAPHARRIDHPGPGPRWLTPLRLGLAALLAAGALVLGTLILLPWRLAAAGTGRPASGREA